MTEADILEKTYFHTADILRPTAVKESIFDEFKDKLIYQGLKCAVSFTKGSQTGETDTVQSIEYVAILFARPEVHIEAGDKVIAEVHGQQYQFLCGEGARYPSHIEIPLIRDDVA